MKLVPIQLDVLEQYTENRSIPMMKNLAIFVHKMYTFDPEIDEPIGEDTDYPMLFYHIVEKITHELLDNKEYALIVHNKFNYKLF